MRVMITELSGLPLSEVGSGNCDPISRKDLLGSEKSKERNLANLREIFPL
jgi:hypothetical protein